MDTIISLAKRRGFVYAGSEIYGGLANSWDYGPTGALLKNNIKQAWIRRFVHARKDMVMLDAALIMNPKVWEASGHVSNFSDPLVECKETHKRYRLDHLLEDQDIDVSGMTIEDMNAKLKELGLKSEAGGKFTEARHFNLMLKTYLGPSEDSAAQAYLRPETAQAIFVDYKSAQQTSRKKIPFGIGQVGKAFRNEITPGNFIFRTREFEQMEIEYFIHPSDWEKHFEAWLGEMQTWLREDIGVADEQLYMHEIPEAERAHYSARTVDIEYKYPFGLKELYGLAYRSDYDLSQHQKHSGETIAYTDPETNETYTPHVIEPTFGVDRTVLVALLEAYEEEEVDGEIRVVLRFPKHIAPISVAILPLSKKPELAAICDEVWSELTPAYACEYDETQSIGKRYRRQDEIGTPYCVTVDFESLEDKAVTVRDRDTMKQERIPIAELKAYIDEKFTV